MRGIHLLLLASSNSRSLISSLLKVTPPHEKVIEYRHFQIFLCTVRARNATSTMARGNLRQSGMVSSIVSLSHVVRQTTSKAPCFSLIFHHTQFILRISSVSTPQIYLAEDRTFSFLPSLCLTAAG